MGQVSALDACAEIKVSDGTRWIVVPPEVSAAGQTRIVYPVPSPAGLRATLVSMWNGLLQDSACPALANERAQAVACAGVVKALSEAVRIDDTSARKLIARLDEVATRYLTNLGRVELAEIPEDVRSLVSERQVKQSLRMVLDRPTAIEALADFWFQHIVEIPATDTGGAADGSRFVASEF